MKLIYCVLILLCPYVSWAQLSPFPLSIGMEVPDLSFRSVINSPSASAQLKQYKGKLVVLNFMATTCTGCIAALPRMDSLQQASHGQVNILLLSAEAPERIHKFLTRRPGLQLAFVPGAAKFEPWFPHQYISHLVWISPQGKVIAITGSDYFTAGNISKALAGDTEEWPVKNDTQSFSLLAEHKVPLFEHTDATGSATLFPANPAYPTSSTFSVDSLANSSALTLANKSLLDCISFALGQRRLPLSHIAWHNIDGDLLAFNASRHYYAAWKEAFLFSYHSVANPALSAAEQQRQMLLKLQLFFGFTAQMKDSTLPAYVLREIDPGKCIDTALLRAYSHRPGLNSILVNLNDQLGVPPVLDGRAIKIALHLPFNTGLPAIPTDLNPLLEKYNLCITRQSVTLRMLVLYGTGTSSFISPAKTYLK